MTILPWSSSGADTTIFLIRPSCSDDQEVLPFVWLESFLIEVFLCPLFLRSQGSPSSWDLATFPVAAFTHFPWDLSGSYVAAEEQ